MTPRLAILACVLSLSMGANSVQASTISQLHRNSVVSLNGNMFGQSFTAIDALLVNVEIYYDDFNAFLGSGLITVDLFEGEGYSGALLDSATRDLAGLVGPQLFAFGNVPTTAGSLYSFRASSASGRGAVGLHQHSFPGGTLINPGQPDYSGGHLLMTDGSTNPIFDMRFQIEQASSVPEPASLLLVGVGLAGAGARRWRRRRT